MGGRGALRTCLWVCVSICVSVWARGGDVCMPQRPSAHLSILVSGVHVCSQMGTPEAAPAHTRVCHVHPAGPAAARRYGLSSHAWHLCSSVTGVCALGPSVRGAPLCMDVHSASDRLRICAGCGGQKVCLLVCRRAHTCTGMLPWGFVYVSEAC